MKKLYENHPEYRVLPLKKAISTLWDEMLEFVAEPSWDEFSDCCYGINRLVGAVFCVKYIRVLPFDSMHIQKCNDRMREYGHFRSRRHLK